MGQRPNLLFSGHSEGRNRQHTVIGHRFSGDPIFLIAGGDGEEDDDDEATDKATVPVGRYLKLKQRMQAADRRANAAEAERDELKPLAEKVPDLEKQVETNAGTIKKLRIDNAFLTSDIQWVDPEAALLLADLSEVEIKEDGTVKGLKEALDKLAEKKPFLVKPKEDEGKGKKKNGADDEDDDDEDADEDLDDDEDDDDDEDEEEDPPASGKRVDKSSTQGGVSGTSTGSGKRRRKGGKGPTDAELMARYRI